LAHPVNSPPLGIALNDHGYSEKPPQRRAGCISAPNNQRS
jgi:hypothetical protein